MSKWLFPLDLDIIGPTSDSMSFKNINLTTDVFTDVEIPVGQHVGAFGVKRKHNCHNGIDLYCEPGEWVFAVEDGTVVDVRQWTGEAVGSPWWEDTWAILVKGKFGVVAYGEVRFPESVKIGREVERGDHLGYVATVLTRDKGRPVTMLHFQMYTHGNLCAGGWVTNDPKPKTLIDPTPFLLDAEQKSEWIKIRVGY